MTSAQRDPRTAALRRFALSITVFNLLGHLWLGFEQAYITPIVAVAFAYALDLALETAEASAEKRTPKYRKEGLLDFLLPAHISGLACAMLLYANDRLWPVLFAVAVAIGGKYIVRVRVAGKKRHILNPSNAGIAITLLVFPWVGIAPPYHFTEWVSGPIDWIIPAFILVAGTMLNAKLTGKMPLILGWAGAFLAQAVIRTWVDGTATTSALVVMTGVAFILFTNYMITDPGTTPVKPRNQVVFGASTAVVYGLLVHFHIVYGLFFALVIVCVARGVLLAALSAREARLQQSAVPVPATSVAVPSSR
ncbi:MULTISPECIES: RnfABCDGE type electron transport complex subunit D [Nonomuraea]|uniref:RnfABCDGE type electron transport complex subunit D n=2 Tax=Nonomuraea TaxID=83681 RepID=A0ABW1C1J8_9ACTN|nr:MULTISPECIES: RnfABCDGE type electron transport complex subunit D [Nonomuraea]MDA0645052.1 RnfABCDGE type electron transport complex subunit D [Nonomuraea ferruginea]TXK40173.1 enediyne biosynthesis protein UnbU [Nonomuraea sp. C10]